MTIPTIQFEAKKHAWRQTQDGVVVSFVVHPNEMHAGFAVAPLGTRYQVVVVQLGDDDQPVSPEALQATQGSVVKADSPPTAGASGGAKRRFNELPLPQQVALRCADERFQEWLGVTSEGEAAEVVRRDCGVASRSAIQWGSDAGTKWADLDASFLETTGQIAEERR